jgi:hypothetical protein
MSHGTLTHHQAARAAESFERGGVCPACARAVADTLRREPPMTMAAAVCWETCRGLMALVAPSGQMYTELVDIYEIPPGAVPCPAPERVQ